jgi:hypothetical protein
MKVNNSGNIKIGSLIPNCGLCISANLALRKLAPTSEQRDERASGYQHAASSYQPSL